MYCLINDILLGKKYINNNLQNEIFVGVTYGTFESTKISSKFLQVYCIVI